MPRRWRALPGAVWVAAAITTASSMLAGTIERFTPGYYDESIYRLLAHNLIRRHIYGYAPGVNIALRPPGYPFFLAAVRSVADAQWLVRTIQALLAGGAVLIAALLAARLFDETVAVATAVLLAVTGVLAAYAGFELSETVATFLLLVAAWLALRARDGASVGWAAGAGASLGLAILVRPQAVLVVPLLALWLLPGRRAALALVAASIATILPWTVRNEVRLHALVPLSTYGGVNFWLANNPRATGDFPGSAAMWVSQQEYARISALPEVEQDREWYRKAFAFIGGHPIKTVRNWARDVAVYVGARDVYPRTRLVFRGRWRPPLLDDRVLWLLALPTGVVTLRRKRIRELLPGVFVCSFVAFFAVFLPLARYRHGIHPFLAIYAAATVVAGIRFVTRRSSTLTSRS